MRCSSPTEFGDPVFTGIHMNGWTEGPFVSRRDGGYSMTLTGNHYLSTGYRIDSAWSKHPLTGFRPDPLNPILVKNTTGPVVGLGHSSSVTGPDLVSTYIAYHNLNSDASRDLDIDRQVSIGPAFKCSARRGRRRCPPAPMRVAIGSWTVRSAGVWATDAWSCATAPVGLRAWAQRPCGAWSRARPSRRN